MLGSTLTFGLLIMLNCHQTGSVFPFQNLQLTTITSHGAYTTEPRARGWFPQVNSPPPQRRHQRRREISRTLTLQARQNFGFLCPKMCVCLNKVVRCEGVGVTEFPQNLPINTERITITGSSIKHLRKEHFTGLHSLTQIILSHNKIETIETGTFVEQSNLQHLDLRQNSLKCLSERMFSGLTNLRVLKLNHNQIQWISGKTFEHMEHLQWISLNGNPLQCDCHLAAVMRGFMSTNRLSIFTASGAMCSQTTSPTFPESSLERTLNILHCLEYEFQPPPSICQLAAETQIPSCESKCSCHTSGYVSCSSGGFTTVPNDLPKDVISLNLLGNKITKLDAGDFSRYKNLRKLNLEGNEIDTISPRAFIGLDRLSSLYLTSNRIESIPSNAFDGLSGLTILYLQNNQISCIGEKSFLGLTNLRILHLSDNQIETLDENVFRELNQLKFLYLVNNRLHCDCHLAWLPAYLKQTEAGDSHWTACSTPALLEGAFVRNLTSDSLQCASADAPLSSGMTARMRSRCQQVVNEEQPLRQEPDADCPTGCSCSELTSRVQRSADDVITFTAPIPTALETREPVLKITCSNADLTSLPSGIPESTRELYLDNNSLKQISRHDLEHLRHLEVLSLHHNQLTCLANDTFVDLPNLSVLLLHSNQLKCIANETFDVGNLKAISIDENPLHCECALVWLPEWMRKNRHRIIASPFPASCSFPKSLEGFPISSLSTSHFGCDASSPTDHPEMGKHEGELKFANKRNEREAKDCSVDDMACCAIPQKACSTSFKCPNKCTCKANRVDCSGRALTEIPEDIHNETKDLFLEHNQIRRIDASRLEKLVKLETLMLSYNSIDEITQGVFSNLKNLRSLILSNNKIQCIHPDAFIGLKQLRVLILQSNDITALADGTLRDLEKLNNIALGQNPLHCDCYLRWLNVFFRTRFLDNGISLCSSPHAMKFQSIFHSHRNNFTCPWLEPATSSHGPNVPFSGPISFAAEESARVSAKCHPCVENPCRNLGVCQPITSLNFSCSCQTPFYGELCKQKMNACFGKPCQNAGVCKLTDDFGHYECVCPSGFTGKDCEENVNNCEPSLCKNGGECVDQVNAYTCKCKPGYRGANCENSFEYCNDVNPCKNGGACIRKGSNGFTCICHDGWSGNDCSENVDDCEYNLCRNGGVCLDHVNDYTCKCPPGYTGGYCELIASDLTDELVRNGSVLTLSHSVVAYANLGCSHNRCTNGASCIHETSSNGYHCRCLTGYAGKFCEKLVSISLPNLNSYVAIDPISRGCLTPRGNLSVTFSTNRTSGVILYYSETKLPKIKQVSNTMRFFAVELFQGHVKLGFALGLRATAVAYSIGKVNDGRIHTLDVIIAGNQAKVFINGIQNALIQASNSKVNQSNIDIIHPLLMVQPIYLAGGPPSILESAKALGQITESIGVTGCILNFYVNGEAIDFSRLSGIRGKTCSTCGIGAAKVFGAAAASSLGTAIGVIPGCPAMTVTPEVLKNTIKPPPLKIHKKTLYPRSGSSVDFARHSLTDCRQKEFSCINGGVCVPNTVPQNQNTIAQHICKCSDKFDGPRCESPALCRSHSRFSFLYDPDTSCVSTRRIVIRSCSGPCQHNNNEPIIWRPQMSDKIQQERRSRRRRRQQQQQHRLNWRLKRNPRDTLRFWTTTQAAATNSNQATCCQPIKFKKRNISFHCPGNGRLYTRWFRFVRKCECKSCKVI